MIQLAPQSSTPIEPPAEPGTPPQPGLPPDPQNLIPWNLALLALAGVAICLWALLCTDWFPVIGGLLGLGGAFAWLAFLSGLLHEDRKKDLQTRFETTVLAQARTQLVILLLILLFFCTISAFGTIEIRSLSPEQHRLLELHPASSVSQVDAALVLPPSSRSRKLVFIGLRHRLYRIRIEGFPGITIPVEPIRPTPVVIPGSFNRRWITLIRPVARITDSMDQNARFALIVARNSRVLGIMNPGDYHGETVWIGCHSDVRLPEWLVDRWYSIGRVPASWRRPLALEGAEETEILPGDKIDAWLLHEAKVLKIRDQIGPSHALLARENIFAHGSGEVTRPLQGREPILEIELSP